MVTLPLMFIVPLTVIPKAAANVSVAPLFTFKVLVTVNAVEADAPVENVFAMVKLP